MRALLFCVALTVCSVAHAQHPYFRAEVIGPWQPSRVSPGYVYYNHSAPVYPVAGRGYYGSRAYDDFQMRNEIRELRWAVEDADFNRRWGR